VYERVSISSLSYIRRGKLGYDAGQGSAQHLVSSCFIFSGACLWLTLRY